MRTFLTEFRRRNVHRTTIAYLATGWLIIEVLQNILPVFDAPEWLHYAAVFILLAGLPLAMWISWEFELTTGGIKRAGDVDPGESFSDRTGRIVDFVIIGILGVAVVLLLSDRYLARDIEFEELTNLAEIRSLAVLPFEDFSPAHDQEHLAVGITDTLLHALAQVKGLKVIARTSAFTYKDRDDVPISTIGEELGVGAVLEGSVQRQDDRLRITAQLIRVSDQSHLWSENFDMEMGDIFRIQDEIANEVAGILQPQSDGEVLETGTTSVEAYEHFVRGRDLWRKATSTGVEHAITELEQAIKLDPEYATAHGELALAYFFSSLHMDRTFDEVKFLIGREVNRALELDSDLAQAWAGKGLLAVREHKYGAAETNFRKAIKLDPNEPLYSIWLANILDYDPARFAESVRLRRRIYELDPRNRAALESYFFSLADTGRFDEARAIAERGIALFPDDPWMRMLLASYYWRHGYKLDDSVRAALDAHELDPDLPQPLRSIGGRMAWLDDQEAAEAWLAAARARKRDVDVWPYWYLRPEDRDVLVKEMEAALVRREGSRFYRRMLALTYIVVDRYEGAQELLDGLRSEEVGKSIRWTDTALALVFDAILAKVMGDEAKLSEVSNRILRMVDEADAQGYEDPFFIEFTRARIAALNGDRDHALASLKSAAEKGLMQIRYLQYLPTWNPYRDDPEFQDILADIEARQREQRESLYADGIRFPPGYSAGNHQEGE